MKKFDYITEHNGVWLQAIEHEKGLIAEFSQKLLSHNDNYLLKEILLVPQDEKTISTRFLERAGFRSMEELVARLEGSRPFHKDYSVLIQHKILNHFFVGLDFSEADWNYSVIYPATKEGPVISVVVGSYYAMKKIYEKGWRDNQFLCA